MTMDRFTNVDDDQLSPQALAEMHKVIDAFYALPENERRQTSAPIPRPARQNLYMRPHGSPAVQPRTIPRH